MFLASILCAIPLIHGIQDIEDSLPLSKDQIQSISETCLVKFKQDLDHLLMIPEKERTFANTIRSWDLLDGELDQTASTLYAMLNIHPEKTIRDLLDQSLEKIQKTQLDLLSSHPEIYDAFLAIKNRSDFLKKEELYYLDHVLFQCKQLGMDLSYQEKIHFTQLQQDIQTLSSLFHRNVSEDLHYLYASKEELEGLDEPWLSSIKQKSPGIYELPCDLPTYTAVLTDCTVKKTRKKMFDLFNNYDGPQKLD